jgi:hypothetical protein
MLVRFERDVKRLANGRDRAHQVHRPARHAGIDHRQPLAGRVRLDLVELRRVGPMSLRELRTRQVLPIARMQPSLLLHPLRHLTARRAGSDDHREMDDLIGIARPDFPRPGDRRQQTGMNLNSGLVLRHGIHPCVVWRAEIEKTWS